MLTIQPLTRGNSRDSAHFCRSFPEHNFLGEIEKMHHSICQISYQVLLATMASTTIKTPIAGTKRKAESTKGERHKKPKITKATTEEKTKKEKKIKKPIVKAPIEVENLSELSDDESDGGVAIAEEEGEKDVDMDDEEPTVVKGGLHPDRVKKVEANSTKPVLIYYGYHRLTCS